MFVGMDDLTFIPQALVLGLVVAAWVAVIWAGSRQT
jgi:hypothetical protein